MVSNSVTYTHTGDERKCGATQVENAYLDPTIRGSTRCRSDACFIVFVIFIKKMFRQSESLVHDP